MGKIRHFGEKEKMVDKTETNMGRTVTLWKLPGSELVAVPLWFLMRALPRGCRINGGMELYPSKSIFFNIIFCLVI